MSMLVWFSMFALGDTNIINPICNDFIQSARQEDGYICALHIEPGDIEEAHIYVAKNTNSAEYYNIRITFSEVGARKLHAAQRRGISRPIAIYIGQEFLSEPIVSELIKGREIEISGGLSFQDAKNTVQKLEKLK